MTLIAAKPRLSMALKDKARQCRLKRRLSQNFLIDEVVLEAITQCVADHDPERTCRLVEIGPGAGFLSDYLAKLDRPLTLIEVDSQLIPLLNQQFAEQPHMSVLHQNVLKTDMASLIAPKGIVVGNLPYHLTGPILFYLMGEMAQRDYALRLLLKLVVVMVQKEVGERLMAKPDSKAYGQLSIHAQLWFDIQPVVMAPKISFYPAPKVDSMVISLIPRTKPLITDVDLTLMSRVVKAGFQHRRKTLLNGLHQAGQWERDTIGQCMAQVGLDPMCRPETVSIAQWGALTNAIANHA